MTEKNLQKSIEILNGKVEEARSKGSGKKIVVLSDSKGKYLQRAVFKVKNIRKENIRWCCKERSKYPSYITVGKVQFRQGSPRSLK